jgi:hypothetical protein
MANVAPLLDESDGRHRVYAALYEYADLTVMRRSRDATRFHIRAIWRAERHPLTTQT